VDDLAGIHALIRPLQDAGVLVARTRDQLELDIDTFWVMVRDGMVIACNAFVPYPDERLAEFACVAVHPDYRGAHRARRLLLRTEAAARRLGIETLFALTTHTSHWFVEHGFSPGGVEDLPMARRDAYNADRNSHVLIKRL
jgi:amino-acid N-acetyltransferase